MPTRFRFGPLSVEARARTRGVYPTVYDVTVIAPNGERYTFVWTGEHAQPRERDMAMLVLETLYHASDSGNFWVDAPPEYQQERTRYITAADAIGWNTVKAAFIPILEEWERSDVRARRWSREGPKEWRPRRRS